MIYRLNDSFILRGWEKRDWALIRVRDNRVRFLSKEAFQALILCDGLTDINEECSDESILAELQKYLREGVVSICDNTHPIRKEQYYRRYNNRFVRSVVWSITGKCNFRCRHCYVDAPDSHFGEMNTEEALNLIDQMAECGVLRVSLTGGEPFVRSDFWTLVDRILERGIKIDQVYTNGWLVNDALLDQFDRRGIKPQFCMSFDGVGCHDWMRGINGAEEKTLKAIKVCSQRGYIVLVQMCLHNGNRDSIRETIRILEASGAALVKIGQISDTDLWIKNCGKNHMSSAEYYDAVLKYIPWYYEERISMPVILGGVVKLQPNLLQYLFGAEQKCCESEERDSLLCGSARLNCYITPDGRLLPCMPLAAASNVVQNQFPLVSVEGLVKGFKDSFYMDFISRRTSDLWEAKKKCATCQYRYQCRGGCRANAVVFGEHEIMGPDLDLCFFYENGYPEKISIVCEKVMAKYRLGNDG